MGNVKIEEGGLNLFYFYFHFLFCFRFIFLFSIFRTFRVRVDQSPDSIVTRQIMRLGRI